MGNFFDSQGRGFNIYPHEYLDCIMLSFEDKSTPGQDRFLSIKEKDIDDIIIALSDAKNNLNRFRKEQESLPAKNRISVYQDLENTQGLLSDQYFSKDYAYLELFGLPDRNQIFKIAYSFARELREGDLIKFYGNIHGTDQSEYKPSFLLSGHDRLEGIIGKSFKVKSRTFSIASEGFAEENILSVTCEYFSTMQSQ